LRAAGHLSRPEDRLGQERASLGGFSFSGAASSAACTRARAAEFGPAYSVSGQQALPFIAAAGLIAAMAALLALLAARTTVRHDIT
jgi:hypothetical protein